MRGKANSTKAKVKGKANIMEGISSSTFHNHSSKKSPQKYGGKKHWQGHGTHSSSGGDGSRGGSIGERGY